MSCGSMICQHVEGRQKEKQPRWHCYRLVAERIDERIEWEEVDQKQCHIETERQEGQGRQEGRR